MDEIAVSDINPTMVATRTFENILHHIQSSNLNFQLQLSPFAATISLTKSLVKYKTGAPLSLTSPCTYNAGDIAAVTAAKKKHENDLMSIKKKYENAVQKIDSLEAKALVKTEALDEDDFKSKKNIQNLNAHIKQLVKEKEDCRRKIETQSVEIKDLEFSNKTKQAICDRLNKELSETKLRFSKDRTKISKEHKAEVKFWQKELGEETKIKIQLEKTIEDNENNNELRFALTKPSTPDKNFNESLSKQPEETLCSICFISIEEYIPEYFLGEKINDACESCKSNDCSWTPDDPFSSFPES